MPTEDFRLRPAEPGDLLAMADQFVGTRQGSAPHMPPLPHPSERVREHFAGWDLTRRDAWVAHADDRLVGQAVLMDDWLEGLYVDPEAQGHGIGSALIEMAMFARPGGFSLWVFTSNEPARRFYRGHGLVELEDTDGRENPEGAPEVRMAWPGPDPLAFFRSQIDVVDAHLGDLLAQRAALTRAVQPHKPTPERDPRREQQVSDAVARRAPGLGPARVGRIMDRIIAESLDALAD